MARLATGAAIPEVVVTGFALTSALGADAEATWQALLDGRSGVGPLRESVTGHADLPSQIGAHLVEEFDSQLTRVEQRRLSFMQKMSTVLGRRVWESIGSPEVDHRRLMVSVGIGYGSSEQIILDYLDMTERGMRAVSPLHVQMFMPNAASAALGLDREARAGVITPVHGDASGTAAIAQAWQHIALGEADIAICGGVENPIEAVPIASYSRNPGVLAAGDGDPAAACRPFDRDRSGMVLGEGGALLVIETEQHANRRGATILGRLLGCAVNSDGFHLLAPNPDAEQAAAALSRAIVRAELAPTDIDHINAHAAGTVDGDLAEATAITKALGGHAPAVYAPKAALGHSFGAAGAVESVLTVLALRDGVVPPTLNLTNLDPRIDLDVVSGKPRARDYRYAINTSFGFGGQNVVLVFGKY